MCHFYGVLSKLGVVKVEANGTAMYFITNNILLFSDIITEGCPQFVSVVVSDFFQVVLVVCRRWAQGAVPHHPLMSIRALECENHNWRTHLRLPIRSNSNHTYGIYGLGTGVITQHNIPNRTRDDPLGVVC